MNFNFILVSKFAPWIVGGVVAVLVLTGGGYYFYRQSQSQQPNQAQTQRAAQEEVKKLVSEVGKLIDLPQGEEPTVATVTDVTKLKDQPFFQKAKNGNKVLIYTNAKKAILYDPTAKKVLDVAPINIGTGSAQTAQPKVVLRNGTTTTGLTTKVETELKKVVADLNVVAKENAVNDYDKTMVVVLNDAGKDLAVNLAKLLDVSTSALPAGESKPKSGDILILLGKDRI